MLHHKGRKITFHKHFQVWIWLKWKEDLCHYLLGKIVLVNNRMVITMFRKEDFLFLNNQYIYSFRSVWQSLVD